MRLLEDFFKPAAEAGEQELQTFWKAHVELTEPSQIETESVRFLSVHETKDGAVLVKIRPVFGAIQLWMPALNWLDKKIVAEGGERRPEMQPPGPRERELKDWAFAGKAEGRDKSKKR